MANELRREVEKVLAQFSDELLRVFRSAIEGTLSYGGRGGAVAPAAGGRRRGAAKAAPVARASRRGARGPKSTPAEVQALGEKIVEVLRKTADNMSAAELQSAVKAPDGPFHYALGKLKSSGRVLQHGERRMARYAIGSGGEKSGGGGRKRGGAKGAAKTGGRGRGAKKGGEAAAEASE